MGSSGSGRFGDYDQLSGSKGSSKGVDIEKLTKLINLDDVATAEYYSSIHEVPSIGERVYINDRLIDGRVVARLVDTNQAIGNIPTEYNYLLIEMKDGKRFSGEIAIAGTEPIPYIAIKII